MPFQRLNVEEYLPPAELRERLLTPALAIDLDRVRHNVRRLLGAAGDDADRLRPHVKTLKMNANACLAVLRVSFILLVFTLPSKPTFLVKAY